MILPLGYSFLPTDEELIRAYLLARVMGLPLPSTVILERDLYGQNTHPCDVFRDIDESNSSYWQSEYHETKGATKKTIYVFTNLVKAGSNSSRIARRAGSGTWSGQTGARVIKNLNGEIIGPRKMFTFQDSTADKGGYHWIMHEYSLDGVYKNLAPNNINKDIVLCKITRSFKGKPTTNTENNGIRVDQIPQPEDTTENNRDIYCFPSACINGGGVGQIPQATAIENNGDGYCFSSAWVNGGVDDHQVPQQTTIENNNASPSSLSGHKRSFDERALLGHCKAQVNPKKPRNCDEDNYDDLWEDLPLADSATINTHDDLFEGLEDIENCRCFADYRKSISL